MERGASSGSSLTWPCPKRAFASRQLNNIPIEVYEEIFSWLRPAVCPDLDFESQRIIFARLAHVCRYFAYYAIHEMSRCLDFDGGTRCTRPRTQTGPWCTGIINRVQPMENLRTKVKECKIHDWKYRMNEDSRIAWTFLKRFPPVVSRLDNLEILTLSDTRISYSLLQAAGRLQVLRKLAISMCYIDEEDAPKEAIFGIHETPFSALRQLTIADNDIQMEDIYKDAFRLLVGATTLRSLVIADSLWLSLLHPHISPHLVSLNGNFTSIPAEAFLRFIKAHSALKDLTIRPRTRLSDIYTNRSHMLLHHGVPLFPSALLDIDQGDLPDLRSFSGPISLASKFIRSRPVSRLALGTHLSIQNYGVPSTSLYDLTVFPESDTHLANYKPDDDDAFFREDSSDVLDGLKTIGGGIQELFVRFEISETSVRPLSSCFPNLVRLQLELWNAGHIINPMSPEVSKTDLAEDLGNFRLLEFLSLSGWFGPSWFWLSPGDQHGFVHRVFHETCATLTTIVFSPFMVWHLRTTPLRIGECHCELELLSSGTIRQELRDRAEENYPERVRDWKDKLASVFGGRPSELEYVKGLVFKA